MPTTSTASCVSSASTNSFERLLHDDGSRQTSEQALVFLERVFSTAPEALGSLMAGQAEEGIGDPALVSASSSYLATDVVQAVRRLDRVMVAHSGRPWWGRHQLLHDQGQCRVYDRDNRKSISRSLASVIRSQRCTPQTLRSSFSNHSGPRPLPS
jgi:hypothetical protein